ncbi:MAG: LamG-like jellyroll fold domain-containing protein [Planctomycetota bacterium]
MRNLPALLLLSVALLSPCVAFEAFAASPSYRWVFNADAIESGQVRAAAGPLQARIEGALRTASSAEGLGALALDGKTNAVIVSKSLDSISLPTLKLTLEGWIFMRSRKEWSGIVGAFQDNGDYERGFVLGCHKDKFYFGLATSAQGKMNHLESDSAYETGRWYHVVALYDGRKASIWVNGKLEAQSDAPGGKILPAPAGFFELGSYHDENEYFRTEGMIHEVGVYPSVMSEKEIVRRYRAKTGRLPSPPREIYGPFSEVFGPFVEFTDRETIEITWETARPSRGSVAIRTGGAKPLVLEESEDRTKHRILVPGILPETLYRYRLYCREAGQPEMITAEYEFDSTFNYAPHPAPLARNPFTKDEWTDRYRDTARQIIQAAGVAKGYCLVLGSGEGRLAYHLAKLSQLRIVAVEKDPGMVRKSREAMDAAGLYGSRVSVHLEGDSLPYGPYFANIICSDSALRTGELSANPAGLYRMLRPCGGIVAFASWKKNGAESLSRARFEAWIKKGGGESVTAVQGLWVHTRSPLPGAGNWGHQYGSPDNSACNDDQYVGGKLRVQWWGRPGPRVMPDRGPRNPAPVSANGRLFVQGMRVLFGLDAYNGAILWSKHIPTMRRANMPRSSSNMVATDDLLYVVVGSQCAGFDAQTGKLVLKADLPSAKEGEHEWGYLAASGDKLVGSLTRKGGNYLGDNGQWFEDFKKNETAKVVSDGLFVLDRKKGTRRWQREQGVVINSTITVSDGIIYFVESRNPDAKNKRQGGRLQDEVRKDQYIVALNLDSGSFLWEEKADFAKCEYTTYMSHHDNTLLVTGTDRKKNFHTYAFDSAQRKPLWEHHTNARKTHHSGQLMHPVIIKNKVFLNKHTFDLKSGKVLKVDPFDYHGCGTMSASAKAIFHRFEYHGMLDLETGKKTEFVGVRGGCWLGQIPAGGLLLAPESGAGCSCTHAIQTSMAFVPEDD